MSRHDFLHHFAADVGQAEVAALEAEGEPGVIDAQEVQDGGLEVVDVDAALGWSVSRHCV